MASNKPYRSGGKPNATGRSEREARFVQLHHWLLESPAYRNLRPIERALLVELARLFNGRNNGQIALGEREAARRLGITSKAAARRAFVALQAHGFIAKTKPSGFNLKDRSENRATEWRLEWQDMRLPGQPIISARKSFMRWPNVPPDAD